MIDLVTLFALLVIFAAGFATGYKFLEDNMEKKYAATLASVVGPVRDAYVRAGAALAAERERLTGEVKKVEEKL